MIITITRKEIVGPALCGTLSINNEYICDTAENALYAIPAGRYRVVRKLCKQMGVTLPIICQDGVNPKYLCRGCKNMHLGTDYNANMPCRCPRLQMGNGIYHRTDSAIILGEMDFPGSIIHPRAPFEYICERVRKCEKRKDTVLLDIGEF